MKKIFYILTLLIFFIQPLNAETVSNSFYSPECVSSIENVIKSKNESGDIEGVSNTINKCKSDILVYNLSNKVLYYIYGDIVKKILYTMNVFVEVDQEYLDLYFNDNTTSSIVSDVIVYFTKAIEYFAIILLGFIYIKLIFNGLRNNEQVKFVKSGLKIGLGLSLLIPLEIFGNFSILQTIVIAVLVFASLLGNIIWLISIFLIEVTTMSTNLNNSLNTDFQDTIKSEVMYESIVSNAKAHYCDIITVEKALNDTLSAQRTEDALMNNEFYQCLKSPSVDLNANTYSRFSKNKNCLVELGVLDNNDEYCGDFLNKSDVFNALDLNGNYQEEVRKLALLVHERRCNDKNVKNESTTNTFFSCIRQDSNYNYEFDNVTGSFLLYKTPDISTSSEIKKQNSIDALSSIDSIISSVAREDKIIDVVKATLSENDKINKYTDIMLSNAKNGWLGSNSIYFSNTSLTLFDKDFINSELGVFDYNYSGNKYINNSLIVYNYLGPQTTPTKSLVIDDYFNDIAKAYKEKMDIKNENNGEQSLQNNLSLKNLIDSQKNRRHDCFIANKEKSGDSCAVSNLNPFYDLIQQGHTISEYAAPLMLVSYIVNKQFTNNDLKIVFLDYVSSLIKYSFSVGIFLGFALPLIPFFMFVASVISWIVNSFRSIIAIQFLGLMYLIPDESEDFEGMEANVYKILISLLIQPFFFIVGFLISFLMIHAMLSITNGTFSIIIGFLNISDSPTTVFEYTENFIATLCYVIILVLVTIKSCTSIYKIPQKITEWFEIQIDNEQVILEPLKNATEKIVLGKFT